MFQNFDDPCAPEDNRERLSQFRIELKKRHLTGFLIPRSDEHMNEYVAPYAERLSWLTGFSGSAGMAVILLKKAAIFVDGRYRIQVRDQVDQEHYEILEIPKEKLTEWLKAHLKPADRLGYDPWLHPIETIERLKKAIGLVGAKGVSVKSNPVDSIWLDQPARPAAPIGLHPLKYAGKTAAEKIAQLQEGMREANEDAAILTRADSISWAFNIRSRDVPHTPLVLSFAILHADKKPELFIDKKRLKSRPRESLGKVATLIAPQDLKKSLDALSKKKDGSKRRVRLDPLTAARWFAESLKKNQIDLVPKRDPCVPLKAIKNATEISGARLAHLRDGVALCRFLSWLDQPQAGGAALSELNEIKAAERLEMFRARSGDLKEISFESISAVGENGAIVHYRVTRKTNKPFRKGSLYLIDSGAQYLEGTTDITRTLAIGTPTKEMRNRFTLVLKGHIALASAYFPEGTRGQDLDPFARRYLWQAGLDFDHGTGHGVGSYLAVHEGPQQISKTGNVALEPGMIVSNEPGYYKEGAYGIRIETLLLVKPASFIKGGERKMLSFETLTVAPIDRTLIDPSLLNLEEKNWLNNYHARVRKLIGPKLEASDKKWLKAATEPF